jgi:ketosteroid isomerase-like protein
MDTDVPEWFANALEHLAEGEMTAWAEIYEDNAVHEFPFAPDWQPKRLEGKAAITAYMQTVPSTVRLHEWHFTGVREAGDELILEGYVQGVRTASGAPFNMEFVWIITHQNGRVSRFMDYMNGLRFTEADAESATQAGLG